MKFNNLMMILFIKLKFGPTSIGMEPFLHTHVCTCMSVGLFCVYVCSCPWEERLRACVVPDCPCCKQNENTQINPQTSTSCLIMADAVVRSLRDGCLEGEHAPALSLHDSLLSPLASVAFRHFLTSLLSLIATAKSQSRYLPTFYPSPFFLISFPFPYYICNEAGELYLWPLIGALLSILTSSSVLPLMLLLFTRGNVSDPILLHSLHHMRIMPLCNWIVADQKKKNSCFMTDRIRVLDCYSDPRGWNDDVRQSERNALVSVVRNVKDVDNLLSSIVDLAKGMSISDNIWSSYNSNWFHCFLFSFLLLNSELGGEGKERVAIAVDSV